jgi:PIN domain nuclease of toxin-antitoxin system
LRLLLDTHIWLWTLSDPKRLGRRVVQQLKDEANELWLSPISTYEALTLYYKGRFEIDGTLYEWLARATAGTRGAPPMHEIAFLS